MHPAFFPNAQGLSITGGSFSNVLGDQHNYDRRRTAPRPSQISNSSSRYGCERTIKENGATATITVVHVNGDQINNQIIQQGKRLTEFHDFRNISRGDICRLQDIHVREHPKFCRCQECRGRGVIKTISIVKVNEVEGVFTAVTYSGPGAREVFEEGFLELSRVLSSEAAQVYAIDNGTIPSVILWHDLVPLSHFMGRVGRLGLRYLDALRRQWVCREEEMWMDPTRGAICRGPEGPSSNLPSWGLEIENLPSAADLLQEDVFMRFLANRKSRQVDDAFLYVIYHAGHGAEVPALVNQLTIFSTLTESPIAIAKNVWVSLNNNLVEPYLDNGLIRFRIDGDGNKIDLELNRYTETAWLSQAMSIFHARGVSSEDDFENFRLIWCKSWLDGFLDGSPTKCQQRQRQPIFLFVRQPPPPLPDGITPSLHYWSFYQDGQSQLPPEVCHKLGLPIELRFEDWGLKSRFWSTDAYISIHQYQVLRGFDPMTTDFARHLGHGYLFHPVNNSDRFQEVHADQSSGVSRFSIDLDKYVTGANPKDTNSSSSIRMRSTSPVLTVDSDHVVARNNSGPRRRRMKSQALADQNLTGYYRQRRTSYAGPGVATDIGSFINSGVPPLDTNFALSYGDPQSSPTARTTQSDQPFEGGLEEVVDNFYRSLTRSDDSDVDALCALFEWLTIA